MSAMPAPLLVIGWGNLARGDDALGPLCLERLAAALPPDRRAAVELLVEHQLAPEHALDLAGRARVLFVDCDAALAQPIAARALQPQRDASAFSHALSPAALLQVYQQLHGAAPPPATLLALRGERFGLGEPPSAAGLAALDAGVAWALAWLAGGATAA